jgi:hypothetical protein
LAILSSNFVEAIPGNAYTILLQAGIGLEHPASISQTGLIPPTAESILFQASFPYAAGWQVSIGGQAIPVTQISTVDASYRVYAGDVSAFAGEVETLEFTALEGSGPTVNLYLDAISFSSSPIPEPSVLCLSAFGGLLLAWRYGGRLRNTAT